MEYEYLIVDLPLSGGGGKHSGSIDIEDLSFIKTVSNVWCPFLVLLPFLEMFRPVLSPILRFQKDPLSHVFYFSRNNLVLTEFNAYIPRSITMNFRVSVWTIKWLFAIGVGYALWGECNIPSRCSHMIFKRSFFTQFFEQEIEHLGIRGRTWFWNVTKAKCFFTNF